MKFGMTVRGYTQGRGLIALATVHGERVTYADRKATEITPEFIAAAQKSFECMERRSLAGVRAVFHGV